MQQTVRVALCSGIIALVAGATDIVKRHSLMDLGAAR